MISLQRTLKDVEEKKRDIAGFIMSCEKMEQLCKEAWKKQKNYSIINILEETNRSKIQNLQ